MPRLAANLTTLFTDVPFLDRFGRAARAGFDAVEFQFPYEFAIDDIRARLMDTGLRPVLFNMPPGDFAAGERGLAALPGREGEFRESVALAIDVALELGVDRLHVMSGLSGEDHERQWHTYVQNLRYAAQFAGTAGIAVLIEPISRESLPGYFLTGLDMAADAIDETGEENLYIQYDLYHRRFVGPDLVAPYLKHAERIAHVQIAGWPGRHEPDDGVLDWRPVFAALDAAGYAGFVGCEYVPAGRTEDGLGWARPWLGDGE